MKPLLMLSVILCLSSCLGQNEPPVINVDAANTAMNGAVQTAKDSLDAFFKNYKSLPDAKYSLKFALTTSSGGEEHIWFNPLEVSDAGIKAECANEPRNIPDLKVGDVRTLKRSDVSDWMILSGGKCYGGYTIRVLTELDPEAIPPFEFADFE